MRTRNTTVLLLALVVGAGCGSTDSTQPTFPDVHPVKGVVKRGGLPVNGGSLRFNPDPDRLEFSVNSEVGPDGTYALTTVRTTDRQGERKTGAAAGNYKVTYTPPLGDQMTAGRLNIVELTAPITVNAGDNDLNIELPAKK